MTLSRSLVRASKTLAPWLLAGVVAAPALAVQMPVGPGNAAAQELAAAQDRAAQLAEAARRAGIIDISPPILRDLQISGSVDVQLPNQSVTGTFNITDDLSGIAYYYVRFRSPSGLQHTYRSKTPPLPLKHVTSTLTVGAPFSNDFTVFDEPGTWVADYFYAYDAAGNVVSYSESQLAALGPTTFHLSNTGGYDNTPPDLKTGSAIRTPVVKLHVPPKGTSPGTPPYVGADLSLQDKGNGIVSGSYEGYVVFCLPNGSGGCIDSFSVYGLTNTAGLQVNTLTVGSQLSTSQTTGTYQMYYMYLYDIAGNVHYYDPSTNFASFFSGGTTIVVKP